MLRKYTIILIFLLAPGLIYASENVGQTTLPLKFNTGNPVPYGLSSTVISIQGKQLPIIFDTGAWKYNITLSPSALKGLHVHFTGKSICSTALNGKQCEKEFIIPKLKIGNFVLKDISGTVMPKLWGGHQKNFIETAASENGVIGYQLLSRFNVLLDYKHSQAILTSKNSDPIKFKTDQWVCVSFYKKLLTHIIINGKPMTMGWDTGSVPSVIKQSSVKAFKRTTCQSHAKFKVKNCLKTNSIVTKSGYHLPSTWFSVQNIPVYAPFDGLFGSNFYRNNLVYFNFRNHKIYIKPN